MLLLLLRRVDEMIIALFISFLACVIFCRLSMVPWWGHFLVTFLVYGLILIFQSDQFTKATVRAEIRERLKREWKFYLSDFESVTANPIEFTWLDLNYYDSVQRELESFGFKKIGDYENLSHTRAFPELRYFSRLFNNTHYDIIVEVGQNRYVKPKRECEKKSDLRTVCFATEFSDGMFLETSNGLGVNAFQEVEGLIIRKFSPSTPLKTLIDTHREEIKKICETKNVNIILIRNAEELYASEKREFLLLCKDRRKKCGFTPNEAAQFFTQIPDINDDTLRPIYVSEYNKQVQKNIQNQRKKQENE
jgi:hypothetical protein